MESLAKDMPRPWDLPALNVPPLLAPLLSVVKFGGGSKASDTSRELVTTAREQLLAYEKRRPPPRTWSVQGLPRTRGTVDTFDPTRLLVDGVDERLTSGSTHRSRALGRFPTPAASIARMLLTQTYFGVPVRVVEGPLRLLEQSPWFPESCTTRALSGAGPSWPAERFGVSTSVYRPPTTAWHD